MMTFAASCRRAAGETSKVPGPVRSAVVPAFESPLAREVPDANSLARHVADVASGAGGAGRDAKPKLVLGALAGAWRRARLALLAARNPI